MNDFNLFRLFNINEKKFEVYFNWFASLFHRKYFELFPQHDGHSWFDYLFFVLLS